MNSWRELSSDPNAKEVRALLQAHLVASYGPRVEDLNRFITDFVRERSVLDIGVVGHVVQRSGKEDFRHGLIRKLAKRLVGIDILEEPVNHLNAIGYDVRLIDALGTADTTGMLVSLLTGDRDHDIEATTITSRPT